MTSLTLFLLLDKSQSSLLSLKPDGSSNNSFFKGVFSRLTICVWNLKEFEEGNVDDVSTTEMAMVGLSFCHAILQNALVYVLQ